jgi:hypothetical protein
MNKVIVIKQEIIKEETNLNYPLYVYYQDEDCNDELIKLNEKEKITIKYNHFGFKIEKTNIFNITENDIKNLTDKKHFDEVFKEAIESLTNN